MMICDDHEVVRTGLANLLAETDIEIVAEAVTGKDALKSVRKKAGYHLLDVPCPTATASPLEKLREKCREQSHHVLIHNNPTYITQAVTWGASDTCSGDLRGRILSR